MTESPAASSRRLASVCVYCGSSSGADPRFEAAARTLGAALARERIALVYGGGDLGLMGVLARSVLDGGGHVVGIIPDFLDRRVPALAGVQEPIVVADMQARKRLMVERADAVIALPGGIGTLEELVEQLTLAQLERHAKPILIADIGGFWQPLLSLFAHMRDHHFIRPSTEIRYLLAERAEDIVPTLKTAFGRDNGGRL